MNTHRQTTIDENNKFFFRNRLPEPVQNLRNNALAQQVHNCPTARLCELQQQLQQQPATCASSNQKCNWYHQMPPVIQWWHHYPRYLQSNLPCPSQKSETIAIQQPRGKSTVYTKVSSMMCDPKLNKSTNDILYPIRHKSTTTYEDKLGQIMINEDYPYSIGDESTISALSPSTNDKTTTCDKS